MKAWPFQPTLNHEHKLLQSRLCLTEVACKMWLMILKIAKSALVSWRQNHYFHNQNVKLGLPGKLSHHVCPGEQTFLPTICPPSVLVQPDLYLHTIYNTSRHTHTCMWFSLRLEMTFSWSSLRTLYRMARLSLSFFSMNKPLSLSSGDGGTERSSDTEPSSGTLQHTHTQSYLRSI